MQLPPLYSFNSIKVRLKRRHAHHCASKEMFQFHKGPIKADGEYQCIDYEYVSIP